MKNLSTTDYFQFSFRSWTNKTTERRTTPWRICFSFVRFRFEWSRSSCRKIQISEFVGRFSSPFKINKFNRFHRTTWNDRDELGRHDDPFVHFDRSLRRFSRRKSNNFRWTKNSWRSSTKRFSLNFRDAARRRRKTMETFETHNRRLDFFADFPNFLWEKKISSTKSFSRFSKIRKKVKKKRRSTRRTELKKKTDTRSNSFWENKEIDSPLLRRFSENFRENLSNIDRWRSVGRFDSRKEKFVRTESHSKRISSTVRVTHDRLHSPCTSRCTTLWMRTVLGNKKTV